MAPVRVLLWHEARKRIHFAGLDGTSCVPHAHAPCQTQRVAGSGLGRKTKPPTAHAGSGEEGVPGTARGPPHRPMTCAGWLASADWRCRMHINFGGEVSPTPLCSREAASC